MSICKTAAVLSALLMLTAGCGKKSSSSDTSGAASTSASVVTETETASAATSAVTTAAKTTSATTTAKTTTQTANASTTEAVQTTTAPPKKERPACADTADAFYQAYLDHDAEKVYTMFYPEEMKAYSKHVKDELEGRDPEYVFRKEAVIKALEASMDNLAEIMDHYSDSENDTWSFSIPDDELAEITSEELKEFNDELGTSFTKACVCKYMFYNDDTNGENFTGISAAFLELGGKWYVSFSTLMGTDLVYFIGFD